MDDHGAADIVAVIGQYVALKRDGDKYKGLCPFHDDKDPSFFVYPGNTARDPKPHWHCYGCDAHGSVFDFVMKKDGVDLTEAKARVFGRHGGRTQQTPHAGSTREHTYVVCSPHGDVIAEHKRVDAIDKDGQPQKKVWWRRNGRNGLNGMPVTELPLYKVETLPEAEPFPDVIITEGEKACDALVARGFTAVGTVTGAAQCPSRESLAAVAARSSKLFLWPDNDAPGKAHMDKVARVLQQLGHDCYMLKWPEAPAKGDAADFDGDVQVLLDAATRWQADPVEATSRPRTSALLEAERLTDSCNAEALAELYGDRLRYDCRRGRWLVWDNHLWRPDATGEVHRLAKEAARERYRRAQELPATSRIAVSKWAIQSENLPRLEAAISLARHELPIADDGHHWDSNRWLLGVPNGVVDLTTGALRAGRQDDRVTMCAAVPYDPRATCPRWEAFLSEVFADEELVDWMQRALGYSLTGDVREQRLFMGYGIGGNGKSTFSRTLQAVLGDYAYNAPFATFELKQRASIPNDVAALEHKRFVTGAETNDNTRLNEARIKALTGCEPTTARFLHQEWFTFEPHLKLWLFVNHKPVVADDSYGFWRRVHLLPFLRRFTGEQIDKSLDNKLLAEGPGILAWLVRGARAWEERGLEPVPAAVASATEAYRMESDPLSAFLANCCVVHEHAVVKASELYAAYKKWAEDGGGGGETLSSTAFGRRIAQKYPKTHTKGGALYSGLGLLFEGDVTGCVTGFERASRNCNVFSPVLSFTGDYAENPSQPVTSFGNPSQLPDCGQSRSAVLSHVEPGVRPGPCSCGADAPGIRQDGETYYCTECGSDYPREQHTSTNYLEVSRA